MLRQTRRSLLAAAAAAVLGIATAPAEAQDPMFESIHFLVPGGAGGGWDTTARTTGRVLTEVGLLGNASYENMSGAGGGRAIGYMIETAERQTETLMVNSTPIIARSITEVFPYSFRDLTPIASIIADFAVIAVAADSEVQSFDDLVAQFEEDPQSVKIAGGSVRGDLDHLAGARAFQAAGGDPTEVAYVPYDAGGAALAGLLSGETTAISTGLGEVVGAHNDGQVRILAVASEERIDAIPDIPTFKELGYDFTFANWRGFFGSPAIDDETADRYAEMLARMQETEAWDEARQRRAWVNLYQPRDEFVSFLETQEEEIRSLMTELGFL